MSLNRDSLYQWPEDLIYDGIRQDASESVRRYRVIENMNWRVRGALTKDHGSRFLTATPMASGNYDTVKGFDAHFSDTTQWLVAVNGGAGPSQDLYKYNTTTDVFDIDTGPTLHATNRPCLFMFGNKLCILDGTTLNAMTAGEVWSTPGSSWVNGCRFGGVYANRAVVTGNATNPYTFQPSAVLDETSWDLSHTVDVTGTYGQEITFMGPCGKYWIVGTRNMTRAYYLGLGGPKDWDFDDVSSLVGGVSWESFCSPARAGGGATGNFSFFWCDEGPMMLVDSGRGVPSLVPLWESIQQAVNGVTWQDITGLDPSAYGSVITTFVPFMNEVRFSVREAGEASNNVLYILDLPSAIRYALSGQDPRSYPYWRIRNNRSRDWVPCDDIFGAKLDSDGQPSSTGQTRMLGVRGGYVYEYDPATVYTDADPDDTTSTFAYKIRKDGYDGYEDGVREYSKSNRHLRLRTTRSSANIYATLYADGGERSGTQTISPAGNSSFWGDGGSWGDGGKWTAGEFATARGELVAKGKKFDMEITDQGEVTGGFSINSWALTGFVDEEM